MGGGLHPGECCPGQAIPLGVQARASVPEGLSPAVQAREEVTRSASRVIPADVVVIGGGVMGSAAARTLGERGVETILLEQFELGHTRGSSHGPARIFRIAYPDPMYVRLAQRAQGAWRDLEAAAGEKLVVTTGGLDSGPLADVVGQSLEACAVPHERLSPTEASDRFPQISFEGLDPIVYQPDAGVARANRTVATQVRLA